MGAQMSNPTEKQQLVLDFIADFSKENGYNPTMQMITDHFGWAHASAAQSHLEALAKKGLVQSTPRGYILA